VPIDGVEYNVSGAKWVKVVGGFNGKYTNTLDAKNRVFVPAAYRHKLGTEFIITRGEDQNLYLYPMEAWEEFEEKIKTLQTSRQNYRAIIRHYFANAVTCSLDSQGRFVIPQELKDWAGLTKEVLFAGVDTKVEIWDPQKYEEVTSSYDINEILDSLPINLP